MPCRILLVDDDREFREEFIAFFEEYAVTEAANGEEALKILKKPNEIDLVILDVNMPGIKGTEVLKEIRAIEPDMGIVILTGYSTESVAIDALKGHADDYLEKPLNIKNARSLFANLLESKEQKASGYADVTDKIEKAKRFVERNCYKKVCLEDAAEAVALSPKYLSRIFKEIVGTGFSDYRLQIKMREAKSLLEKTLMNIDQIAYKLGYQNTESFTRLFKELSGKTPTEYRKKHASKAKKVRKKRK
jgi:two-component system, response regulator YesN